MFCEELCEGFDRQVGGVRDASVRCDAVHEPGVNEGVHIDPVSPSLSGCVNCLVVDLVTFLSPHHVGVSSCALDGFCSPVGE